jgi:hypothetical protein
MHRLRDEAVPRSQTSDGVRIRSSRSGASGAATEAQGELTTSSRAISSSKRLPAAATREKREQGLAARL